MNKQEFIERYGPVCEIEVSEENIDKAILGLDGPMVYLLSFSRERTFLLVNIKDKEVFENMFSSKAAAEK